MTRGSNQHGQNSRGRSRGRPGRGRGANWGSGRGRGGKGRGAYHTIDDLEQAYFMSDINIYSPNTTPPPPRGPRFRGQSSNHNSGSNTPTRGTYSPRSRGRGQIHDPRPPRGRGRGSPGDHSPRINGRGRGGSKLRPDAPLSRLLYQERPLLRPIVFVPSLHTKVLFEEVDEIFQPIVEKINEEEKSHVPTAERVSRVFSGGNFPRMVSSAEEDGGEEELEEIDFNDMEKLLDISAPSPDSKINKEVAVVEEKFLGIYIDTDPATATTPAPTLTPSSFLDTTPHHIPESTVADRQHHTHLAPDEPLLQNGTDGHSIAADPVTIEPKPDQREAPLPEDLNNHISGDANKPMANDILSSNTISDGTEPAVSKELLDFYIDTEPSHVPSPPAPPEVMLSDDDEIIVYVAPHPRTGRITPAPPPVYSDITSLPSTSILTGTTPHPISPPRATLPSTPPPLAAAKSPLASSSAIPPPPSFESVSFSFTPTSKITRQQPPLSTRSKFNAELRLRQQEARAARKRMAGQAIFSSFGAIMSEAQLRGEGPKRDPRWQERRRGDSDVDWGDEGEGDDDMRSEGLGGLAEGMELDPELELDKSAMKRFVEGMGQGRDRFVTMDDIADEELMQMEDEENMKGVESSEDSEEDDESTDDEDVDAVVNAEEEILIAEETAFGDLESSDDSDDDESNEGDSPRSSFQARLERLRNQAQGKGAHGHFRSTRDERSSDEDGDFMQNSLWEDEDLIDHIEAMFEENEAILTGHDRRARNRLFRAIRDGTFDDIDAFKPAKKNKEKYKELPTELQEQWQKDREKKAENKRARALTRLALAADPLAHHKGGKKGRKAMLAAAKLDPMITVIPNRVIDMVTLVQQIRRFLADIGGPQTMSLPPTNKETRKNIHEMALAFGLKSLSKGKGDARYTTLSKTTRSGINIDEKKVTRIVRRSSGRGGGEFMGSNDRRDRGQGKPIVPRHREGDEVGKAAPRIGESNIGFKMLTLMGWSEGDRIGVTGGLEVPLTAVIKNSKLGLGATK